MGTARIISHIGDGKYEVKYYNNTDPVKEMLNNFKNTLIEVEEKLLEVDSAYQTYQAAINERLALLDEQIDLYNVCINNDPASKFEKCKPQYENIIKIQTSVLDVKSQSSETFIKLETLIAEQIQLNKNIQLYGAVPQSVSMNIWCVDCCDREELESPIGAWYGHALIIPNNTMVNTIEIWSVSGKREIRIDQSWESPAVPQNCLESVLAHDKFGANYNSVMVVGQETWKPSFRKAIIKSLNKDDKLATILVSGSKYFGDNLNTQMTKVLDATINYMDCSPKGLPFKVGDSVIVKFIDQNITRPSIIGYADNPKPCVEKYKSGYTFSVGDPSAGYTFHHIEKNNETGIWEVVATNTTARGMPLQWKKPNSNYVISWMIPEVCHNCDSLSYQIKRWTTSIMVDGVLKSTSGSGSVLCACWDINGNHLVVKKYAYEYWDSGDNTYHMQYTLRLDRYDGAMVWQETIWTEFYDEGEIGDPSTLYEAFNYAKSFNGDGSKIAGSYIGFDIEINLSDYTITSHQNSGGSGIYQWWASDYSGDYNQYGNFGTDTSEGHYNAGFACLYADGEVKTHCVVTNFPSPKMFHCVDIWTQEPRYTEYVGFESSGYNVTNYPHVERRYSMKTMRFSPPYTQNPSILVGIYLDQKYSEKNPILANMVSWSGYQPWDSCGSTEETMLIHSISFDSPHGDYSSQTGTEQAVVTIGWQVTDADGQVLMSKGSEAKGNGWPVRQLAFHHGMESGLGGCKGWDGEWGFGVYQGQWANFTYALDPNPRYYFSGADLDNLIPTLAESALTENIYFMGPYLIKE